MPGNGQHNYKFGAIQCMVKFERVDLAWTRITFGCHYCKEYIFHIQLKTCVAIEQYTLLSVFSFTNI